MIEQTDIQKVASNKLIHIIYLAIIVFLVIILLLYRQTLLKTKAKLESAMTTANVEHKMTDTEKNLEEMKKREKEYPDLQKKIQNIESAIRKLEASRKNIPKPVYDSTMKPDVISKELQNLGYSNEMR